MNGTALLLWNTLLFSGVAALLSVPLGVLIAWLTYRDAIGQRYLLPVLLALIFLPPYVHVAGWDAALGLQGWLVRWLWPNQPLAVLTGWRGALFMQTLINVPWIVLMSGSVLSRLPHAYEELGAISGTPWQVLRNVHWPQLSGTCLAAGLWVFVLSATDVTITDVYQIRTFAEEIYTAFALGDTVLGATRHNLAGSLLIVIVASIAYRQSLRLRSVMNAPVRNLRPARASRWGRAVLIALLLLWTVIPWSSLLYQAGVMVSTVGDERVRSWSLAKAFTMIAGSPQRFGSEFAWSLALGQVVSLTLVPLTALFAWWSRQRRYGRWLLAGVAILLAAIPAPLLALGTSSIINRPDADFLYYLYDRTLFVPWLAVSMRLFPLVCFILVPHLDAIPQQTLDVIRVSGGGRWTELRHAIWPAMRPTLIWLWLVTLAAAVADLSASILAVPPGVTTLSIRIFNLVHYGVTDQLAGLCLAVMLMFGGLTAFVLHVRSWSESEV